MVAAANLVEVAALVGDTARATMLSALMGGQSLTATELAYCANAPAHGPEIEHVVQVDVGQGGEITAPCPVPQSLTVTTPTSTTWHIALPPLSSQGLRP
jgi:hypothetical protein